MFDVNKIYNHLVQNYELTDRLIDKMEEFGNKKLEIVSIQDTLYECKGCLIRNQDFRRYSGDILQTLRLIG